MTEAFKNLYELPLAMGDQYSASGTELRKPSSIHFSFEIQGGIEQIVHDDTVEVEDLDLGWAFLRPPFRGWFRFSINGEHLLPSHGPRCMLPYAYVEWLLTHHNTYMNESKTHKAAEGLRDHLFADELGDYSPQLLLWRSQDKEIISSQEIPYISRDRKVRVVPASDLSAAIKKVSYEAIIVLEQNSRFKESKKLAELKEMLARASLL